jgi:hypothetical protein
MTIHGTVLCGQKRYAEAESLLLKGYAGMNQAFKLGYERRLLAGAGKWIVDFYEVTNQTEKANAWREKFATENSKGPTP